MKHLIIRNVGPIENVDIELKRFNFLIGPQSSGKSTVAKILSTCTWVEKEVLTTLNDKAIADGDVFLRLLEKFHKIEGYFSEKSVVIFETENITIAFADGNLDVKSKNTETYHREKICYIPAERNMVTLPELQGFEFGQTNLRSFLFDWFYAREYYVPENKTDILNLGVRYYYDSEQLKQKDRIEHVNGNPYRIALASASSGLQSVVPLLVMLQYYTGEYFHSYEEKISFDGGKRTKDILTVLLDKYVLKKIKPNLVGEERGIIMEQVTEGLKRERSKYLPLMSNYFEAYSRLLIPERSTFIIEEPEQNLYPSTQMDLLDLLVTLCKGERKRKRKHGFTITTHSPYILNRLNLLVKRFDAGAVDEANLEWDEIAVWAVENGEVCDLKLKNTHLVNPEYLSKPLDYIYDQYEQYEQDRKSFK